jgi:alpha-N-arabinofuranosidase
LRFDRSPAADRFKSWKRYKPGGCRLVRYVDDHWTTHNGFLWELGNELWGNWNNAYPTLGELAQRTRQFSEAVKQVDSRARVIATGQDPDHFHEWNAMQLTNPVGTFDLLSTHFVVDTDRLAGTDRSPHTVARDTFAFAHWLGAQAARDPEANRRRGTAQNAHRVHRVAVSSVCRQRREAPSFNNLGGAIAAAGFLNMILRNADIVPVSDMTGIIEFAGIWKKRSQVFGTPSYYAFQMFSTANPTATPALETNSPTYSVRGGVTRIPEIPDVPYLDAVAVRTAAGISLFCINRNLNQDLKSEIAFDGVRTDSEVAIQELFAQSPYAVNDEVHPLAVTPKRSSSAMTGSHLVFVVRHASITRIDFKQR